MDFNVLRISIKDIITAIADLAMPRVCLCCGRTLGPDEEHLCPTCLKDLPLTRYWKLRENPMAESFNALIQKHMGEDVRYRPYGYACALFFYKGEYKAITKALKYKRNSKAGKHFARILGQTLAQTALFRDVDLVVPIPLHWTRRWRRGYNQAEVIAKEVAAELGVPCDARMLQRARHTRTQTHLNLEGRAANVAGAFRVRRSRLWQEMVAGTRPRHLLLIDDVFTTGATAAACEMAIHLAGDRQRVSVATLACVEH